MGFESSFKTSGTLIHVVLKIFELGIDKFSLVIQSFINQISLVMDKFLLKKTGEDNKLKNNCQFHHLEVLHVFNGRSVFFWGWYIDALQKG